MINLTSTSRKTFRKLIEDVNSDNPYRKWDCSSFMAVHVNFLYSTALGDVYSLAHRWECNGDMMDDPDMEFLVTPSGIYPMTFSQASPSVYHVAASIHSGAPAVSMSLQRDLASFANLWLKNIKHQQRLEV